MPSVSSLIIAAIWIVAIAAAIWGGTSAALPEPLFPGEIPLLTIATVLSLPVLIFGVSSFWMRHSPFYHPKLAKFINARLGPTLGSLFRSGYVRCFCSLSQRCCNPWWAFGAATRAMQPQARI
jgi:hypothetical protein